MRVNNFQYLLIMAFLGTILGFVLPPLSCSSEEEPSGGYVGTISLVGTEAEVEVFCGTVGTKPEVERGQRHSVLVRCIPE